GVARVQRREHQVAGLGGGERPLGRIPIAHLAHEDHVRVLTQAVAKAPLEALHVPPHLALRHQGSLARQAVLDGIFQRDDAAGPRYRTELPRARGWSAPPAARASGTPGVHPPGTPATDPPSDAGPTPACSRRAA